MEYHSALKRRTIPTHTTWMNLEDKILSEKKKEKKEKKKVITITKKNGTKVVNNYIIQRVSILSLLVFVFS